MSIVKFMEHMNLFFKSYSVLDLEFRVISDIYGLQYLKEIIAGFQLKKRVD